MSNNSKKEIQIIIQFDGSINFSLDFLGIVLPFQIKEFSGFIEFPSIKKSPNSVKELCVNSILDPFFGKNFTDFNWGKVNDTSIYVNSLLLRFNSNSKIDPKDIEPWMGIFKKHIEISSPQTSRKLQFNSDRIVYGIETPPKIMVTSAETFKLKNIEYVLDLCRNLDNIPIDLDLINEARIQLEFQDFRRTVIDCSTALEITLTRVCEKKLLEIGNENFVKNILANKYRTLGNKLQLSFFLEILIDDGFHEDIVNLRNKIIHKGYKPSNQEANTAFKKSQKIVKMFSDLKYFN